MTANRVGDMQKRYGRPITEREFEKEGASPTEHLGIGGGVGKGLKALESGVWFSSPGASKLLTPIFNKWASGKDKYQMGRDYIQTQLRELGIGGYNERGETIPMMSDGSFYEPNMEDDTKGYSSILGHDAEEYAMSDENVRDPMWFHLQGAVRGITNALMPEPGRNLEADMVANYYATAVSKSQNPEDTVMNWYRKLIPLEEGQELDHNTIITFIGENYKDWGLTKEQAIGIQNNINYLFEEGYDREAADKKHTESIERYLQEAHSETYKSEADLANELAAMATGEPETQAVAQAVDPNAANALAEQVYAQGNVAGRETDEDFETWARQQVGE